MKKIIIVLLNLFIVFQLYSNSSENVFNKVFVLGNSLTLGFTTHGMASTDINSDYYYWVKQALLVNNPDLSMSRKSGTPWEKGNSTTRLSFLNNIVSTYITGEEDLIIIQLGDNIGPDVRVTLTEDAVVLLSWFNTHCPNAKMIWVYGWYSVAANMPLIKNGIEESGICELVDISGYSYSTMYKSAIGNTYINSHGEVDTITDAGVASHPGDLGMEKIAYEIINSLETLSNKIDTVDSPNSQAVSVFPNPSNGKFTVTASNSSNSINIYNVMGTKVFSTSDINLLTNNEIDISDSEKGIFFIKIAGRDKIHTEKIVIQ